MTVPLNNPNDVIRAYLITEGVCGEIPDPESCQVAIAWPDWPVVAGSMPDGKNIPDNFVSVHNTTPIEFGRIMETNETTEHAAFQIKLRGRDDRLTHQKGRIIEELFKDTIRVTVVLGVSPDEERFFIQAIKRHTATTLIHREPDNRRRYIFSANFSMSLTFLGG